MAPLQFEGLLAGLSERQLDFIRAVLKERGFMNNRVLFSAIGKAGENFIANVLRVTVVVDDGQDQEEFSMIAKIAPQLDAVRNAMETKTMFDNEIIMYEQILPNFERIQTEAGVSENERVKYAKCYGHQSEEPHEVILLEDLKPLKYVTVDKTIPLNEDAVLLVLKNFAILHSMSFVFKRLDAETYNNLTSRLVHVWSGLYDRKDHIAFMTQLENNALEILIDERHREAIRGVISERNELMRQCKKHENPKYFVFVQGDAWTNNIMFKLNRDRPVDAIIIDYQLSAETSPVEDLLYFIFNSTEHVARSKHYHEWINFYHKQLEISSSYFGLRANFVYPKDQLEADLKRYSKIFLGAAVWGANILSRNPEELAKAHEAISNFDEDKIKAMIVDLSEDSFANYKLRLQGLIESYIEFGYFRKFVT